MAIPTLVQSASNLASSTSAVTVTLGSSTTLGNCLVVCVFSVNTGGTAPTVSSMTLGGSAGNFALAKAQTSGGSGTVDTEGWTDQNCAAGQTAVAVNMSSSPTELIAVAMEWSGIISTGAVDATNGSGSNSGSSWSSGSTGTLGQANEVAIGWLGFYGALGTTGGTPGAPWTELTPVVGGSGVAYVLDVGYQVVSSTTALTYSGTATNAVTYGTGIITLKGKQANFSRSLNVNQSVMRAAIW